MLKKDPLSDIPKQSGAREFFVCIGYGVRSQLSVYPTIIAQQVQLPFSEMMRGGYARLVRYDTDADLIKDRQDFLKKYIEELSKDQTTLRGKEKDEALKAQREELATYENKTKLPVEERNNMLKRKMSSQEKISVGMFARNAVIHPVRTLYYISQVPLIGLISLSSRVSPVAKAPLVIAGMIILAPLTALSFVQGIINRAAYANERRHENLTKLQSVQPNINAAANDSKKMEHLLKRTDSPVLESAEPGAKAVAGVTPEQSVVREDTPLIRRSTQHAPLAPHTRFSVKHGSPPQPDISASKENKEAEPPQSPSPG